MHPPERCFEFPPERPIKTFSSRWKLPPWNNLGLSWQTILSRICWQLVALRRYLCRQGSAEGGCVSRFRHETPAVGFFSLLAHTTSSNTHRQARWTPAPADRCHGTSTFSHTPAWWAEQNACHLVGLHELGSSSCCCRQANRERAFRDEESRDGHQPCAPTACSRHVPHYECE